MEEWLTIAEAARRIGFGTASVQRWCREGRIAGAKLSIVHGRICWLVPAKELASFVPPSIRWRKKKDEADAHEERAPTRA